MAISGRNRHTFSEHLLFVCPLRPQPTFNSNIPWLVDAAVVVRSVPPIFPRPSAKPLRSLRQSMTMVRFALPLMNMGTTNESGLPSFLPLKVAVLMVSWDCIRMMGRFYS